jgi:probable H4MPT-linked C1 transfer pathway protein
MLIDIINKLFENKNYRLEDIDYFAITITAELSDAFQTKKEGILTILDALGKVFENPKLKFISNKSSFLDYEVVRSDPYSIAAANWVSTALFLGHFVSECILIDAGSTTIDIIPILNSFPIPQGKDDISRLINHELIYTGGLRATIPSITHHVPFKEKMVRISFEKFALVSDVHRILGNISEEDYINDTADNRSKSLQDCYARLSRLLCMDIETISKEDLDKIAEFIYKKQLAIISREVISFMNNLINRFKQFENNPQFIITGSSADFLIRKALLPLGYPNISSYEEITNLPSKINSSAFAVAGALYYQLE